MKRNNESIDKKKKLKLEVKERIKKLIIAINKMNKMKKRRVKEFIIEESREVKK